MNITSIISICIAAASLIFVAVNYGTGRQDKNNIETEEIKTSLIKCNMKLDQLCATTNSIQTDIKAMQGRVTDLEREIAVIQRDIEELKSGKYLPELYRK